MTSVHTTLLPDQDIGAEESDEIQINPPAIDLGRSKNLTMGSQSNGEIIRRPEIELLIYGARTYLTNLARSRISEILRHNLDWNEVIDKAAAHAVVPLLCRNLNQYSDVVPDEVLRRFRVLTNQSNIHNLHLAASLSRLINLMERNGINSLPFKGPVLASAIYGDLSLRQFSDLDILIPKKDIQRAKELFVRNGFVPLVDRTLEQDATYLEAKGPYNYKFISSDGYVLIELHWEFTSKYNSFAMDYNRLVERLVPVEFAGHQVRHLEPEDLLLILSQHGSKHFWTRLLWLVDIVEVLRTHQDLDWKETIIRAQRMGVRRMLFLGLHLAGRLLDFELPLEVSKNIQKEPKIKVLAARIEEQLFSESRSIRDFESHIFSCAMRERLRDKIRYSGYRVLHYVAKATTPTEKDLRALPQSMSTLPLAYVFRPPRLLLEASSSFIRHLWRKYKGLSRTQTGSLPRKAPHLVKSRRHLSLQK